MAPVRRRPDEADGCAADRVKPAVAERRLLRPERPAHIRSDGGVAARPVAIVARANGDRRDVAQARRHRRNHPGLPADPGRAEAPIHRRGVQAVPAARCVCRPASRRPPQPASEGGRFGARGLARDGETVQLAQPSRGGVSGAPGRGSRDAGGRGRSRRCRRPGRGRREARAPSRRRRRLRRRAATGPRPPAGLSPKARAVRATDRGLRAQRADRVACGGSQRRPVDGLPAARGGGRIGRRAASPRRSGP